MFLSDPCANVQMNITARRRKIMLDVQLDYRYCPTCDAEQLFEAPACEDGHGADCPELACVTCGTALHVLIVTETAARPRVDKRRSA